MKLPGRKFILFFSKIVNLFCHNPGILNKKIDFPAYIDFETNWQQIKKEFNEFTTLHWQKIPALTDFSEEQVHLVKNENHKWRFLIINLYGTFLNETISPTLTALLKKHNATISGASFSCIEAHKKVPPHYGPNKAVLRFTLPLSVPKDGECYLIIDGTKVVLKEGVGVFWDDTYLHSTANEGSEIRTALLLDIRRKLPMFLAVFYYCVIKLAKKTKTFKKLVNIVSINY